MCDAGTDACAIAMKVRFHPGVLGSEKVLNWADRSHLAVGESGDPITDGVQAVKVMGNHEDSQTEGLLQRGYQHVEFARGDRIETGGGLVEKDDLWIEGERPRKCCA